MWYILLQMDCCGVEGPKDWPERSIAFNNTDSVPDSCCIENTDGCGVDVLKDETPSPKIYHTGCLDKFTTFVEEQIEYVGGIGIGIAFIQVSKNRLGP